MTRRAGLLVLLVAVVLAALLAWAPRGPSGTAAKRTAKAPASGTGGAHASALLPTRATPAKITRGRLSGGPAAAPDGYDVSIAAIPLETVLDTDLSVKDVPPLDTPAVTGTRAGYPAADCTVIGIVVDGVARAYRTDVLDRHWAVNDVIDGRRVAVLWDPIAGAAGVYQGTLDGKPIEVGVSGKWYQGSALFYDRQSTSLVPAITGRFITGPLAGRVLRPLPYRRESWKAWREEYPESRVLEAPDGTDLSADPFHALDSRPEALAPLRPAATGPERVSPTAWVIGFVDPVGKPTCCVIEDLPEDEALRLDRALVQRQPDGGAHVTLSGGEWPLQTVCRYFAWAGVHPDTEVWPEKRQTTTP